MSLKQWLNIILINCFSFLNSYKAQTHRPQVAGPGPEVNRCETVNDVQNSPNFILIEAIKYFWFDETSSTYNRSWKIRSIVRFHSSIVQSKTGIPYQKLYLPLTTSWPSRLGLSSLNITCLIRFHSPLLLAL